MEQPQRHSEPPTTDRFRADISRGRTGEKVNFPDPAAAPLGTDDEAAGHAPTSHEREMEDRHRPQPNPPPESSQGPVVFYFGIAAVIAIVIILASYSF